MKAKLIISSLLTAAALFAGNKEVIKIDGSTTVGPIVKAFSQYMAETEPNMEVSISESGSGNGVKSLINGGCEIAAASRFMKDKEFKSAVEKGVLPVAHTIAYDGLAVVVNPDNKVGSLSLEQLQDIYLGKIKNWKDLGGDDGQIVVISRDTNSGTYETFMSIVMNKKDLDKGAEYVGSNGQAKARVQTTKNAIAYVGLGFAHGGVKAISVNKILPNATTIASGVYPIARPLYLFTNGSPKMGSNIFKFITFYLTEEGQDIISDIGFVPVTKY